MRKVKLGQFTVLLSKNEHERFKGIQLALPGERQAKFNEWFANAPSDACKNRRRAVAVHYGLKVPE